MNFRKVLLGAATVGVPAAFLLYPAYVALTGCATAGRGQVQQTEAIPDYVSGLYNFPKFDLPAAKKSGSVELTAISIVPEYKDTRGSEYLAGDKARATGGMTREMANVFKSFAGSAGEDIEALLVAKGMTSKGPFVLDEVTFPDKKGADLTVLMQLIFDFQYGEEKYARDGYFEGGRHGKVYEGDMSVGLKVYYYLLEPLSEEKMWVKKLDLGTQDFPYELAREQEQYVSGTTWVSDGCGGGHNRTNYAWRDTKKMLFDSRPKLFSDMLKQAYPQLMQTAWKYFDADEMLALKAKAKEIRDRWGSSSYRRGAPD